jgi:membrane-associated phospholipid phosphatase
LDHAARLVRRNRRGAWASSLAVALVVFLAVLPLHVRLLFWHGLQKQAPLAALAIGFSLLALSLIWSAGQRVDAWAFLVFNLRGVRPLWLDRLMLAFTQLGNGTTAFVLAVISWAEGMPLLAYELVLGTLTLWLVVELIKALAHRRRPFLRLERTRVVGRRPIGRSFPSGHTSQAFFLATVLAQHFGRGALALLLLYILALFIGLTRMYVGAHYPRDVLAGAILGTAWGLLGAIVDSYVVVRIG